MYEFNYLCTLFFELRVILKSINLMSATMLFFINYSKGGYY
ncbi:hypothetical protein HMPREF3218_0201601 [Prevotella bivia]|nr:hypothetical protein HMPREF3218_0201601 [Prevotella bivia]